MPTLRRFCYLETGTLGELTHHEMHVCWILEPPWRGNQVNVSCIPDGLYDVRPDAEGRYIGHPEICGVAGRSEIIIHPANHPHQLHGCMAPGMRFEIKNGVPVVWESDDAYAFLVKTLGTKFQLKITSARAE